MRLSGLSGLSGLGEDYRMRVLATIPPANLLDYWVCDEASGTTIVDSSGNARDGVYSGVTLGEPGIGDGRTCPRYDGVQDYGNNYSASLAAAFNPLAGTAALWYKPEVGVLTDATVRYLLNLRADANNRVSIRRNTVNNTFVLEYVAGGTNKNVTAALTFTEWTHIGATWDKAADQVWCYVNGVKANINPLTGLGTWVGALAPTTTLLGANASTPTAPWHGYLAHCAVWNLALTPAQMALIGVR